MLNAMEAVEGDAWPVRLRFTAQALQGMSERNEALFKFSFPVAAQEGFLVRGLPALVEIDGRAPITQLIEWPFTDQTSAAMESITIKWVQGTL